MHSAQCTLRVKGIATMLWLQVLVWVTSEHSREDRKQDCKEDGGEKGGVEG